MFFSFDTSMAVLNWDVVQGNEDRGDYGKPYAHG
jgi:hypothetical protein